MELIHINRQFIDDPNYRYMMERVLTKEISGGTVLINLDEISGTLNFPKEIILQFICSKIGATKIDEKNLIKKEITFEKVQNLIYEFIESYKICELCKQPEIIPILEKNNIFKHCCGCNGISKLKTDNKSTDNLIKRYLVNGKYKWVQLNYENEEEQDSEEF